MTPIAHGDIGSADEIAIAFVAFILLLAVIGMAIRDWWRGRKRKDQPGSTLEDGTSRID